MFLNIWGPCSSWQRNHCMFRH